MTGREMKKAYDGVTAKVHIKRRHVGVLHRLRAVGGLALVIFLFIAPDAAAEGVRAGIALCVQSVIPALFPFLVLSPMLVYSLYAMFLLLCRGRLDGRRAALWASFAVGMTAGFPIGAVTLVSLYRQGILSRSDAERYIGICTGASPAFLCGYFGQALWDSTAIGFLLWGMQCIICFVGMLWCMSASASVQKPHMTEDVRQMPHLSDCLREAVGRMAGICGAIVFFSVLRALMICCLPRDLAAVLGGLAEMTGGLRECAALYNGGELGLNTALTLSAAMIGFGGACVGMQTADTAISAGLSMRCYWIQHAMIGAMMALTAVLYCMICR